LTYNKKMIESPSSGIWKFWDYVSPNGNNLIEEWRQGLSDTGRFMFDNLLKNNRKTEKPLEWIGFKRFIKGQGERERLWELHFYSDKRQYRMIGAFGPGRKEAALLLGCYHKQRAYSPPDAIETAFRRKRDLWEGIATFHERTIALYS